ncbi:BlaI/MecI/CopY family transcriptional regulator, partial [Streptomyces sp. SPB78]|uniref:BlaI/MecI/CopY family transcriptional regulator n=1 Tax=Streptomyces sp. (strain SPB78) TaxID=591157 RepID=UPI001F24CE9C
MSGTERNGGRRRGQGELEARVLAVLHSAPGPVPAGWVREHVGGELAYTTVMTILTRLRSKDAVTRELFCSLPSCRSAVAGRRRGLAAPA